MLTGLVKKPPHAALHAPTPEQVAALALFAGSKSDLAIQAFAGSGKTSTLRMLALAHPGVRFLYLAYNKALEVEASRSFPPNVETRTAHSLAYRGLGIGRSGFQARLGAVMRADELMRVVGIRPPRSIPAVTFLYAVRQTVRAFQCSAAARVEEEHIPGDLLAELQGFRFLKSLPVTLVKAARTLWAQRADERSTVPIEHDTYLKLWQLTGPCLRGVDCILFDEAQDANPVILDVVRNQTARKVFVGDTFQQIYSWRGAINAFESLGNVERLRLSKSFRFGEAIAKAGRHALLLHALAEGDVHFAGGGPLASEVGLIPKDAAYCHIFRTNAAILDEACALAQARCPFAVVGDFEALLSFLESAYALSIGRPAQVRDERLRIFPSWEEACLAAKNDKELSGIVKLVRSHGDTIPKIAKDIRKHRVEEPQARVVLTSAHRAKGREWDFVRVEDDFGAMPSEARSMPKGLLFPVEEVNLLYVAVTRARRVLEISGPMKDLLAQTHWTPGKQASKDAAATNRALPMSAMATPNSLRQGAVADAKTPNIERSEGCQGEGGAAPRRKTRAAQMPA
jgi:hypothetical protein